MAIGDIYKADIHFESPSMAANTGLYFRETTANASNLDTTSDLAESIHTAINGPLRNILSSEWWFTGVTCQKMHPTDTITAINPVDPLFPDYQKATVPKRTFTADPQGGNYNGGATEPSLPANNTIQLDLTQSTFSLKSNGRMNFCGIPEAATVGGQLIPAYVTDVEVLAAILAQPRNSPGDTGVWEPVVVSAKVRDLAGPNNPKDWIGSIAPIDDIVVTPIIAIQRRRATRVKGGIR